MPSIPIFKVWQDAKVGAPGEIVAGRQVEQIHTLHKRTPNNLITIFPPLPLTRSCLVDITRPSSPVQASLPPSPLPSKRHKVAIVGSGSFGTALAKIVAKNVASRPKEFHSEVRMWVREKIVSQRKVFLVFYLGDGRFGGFGELIGVLSSTFSSTLFFCLYVSTFPPHRSTASNSQRSSTRRT